MFIPKTKTELLARWLQRLRLLEACHYEAAIPLGNLNLALGIPVVILTTIVGTAVFATLEKALDPTIKIMVALISVLAAVLASLQTFLRFSDKAEAHRVTAVKAGTLRREIERLLVAEDPAQLSDEKIIALRDQIDQVGVSESSIPPRIYKRTKERLSKE